MHKELCLHNAGSTILWEYHDNYYVLFLPKQQLGHIYEHIIWLCLHANVPIQ